MKHSELRHQPRHVNPRIQVKKDKIQLKDEKIATLREQVKKLEDDKKKLIIQLVDYEELKSENERLKKQLAKK